MSDTCVVRAQKQVSSYVETRRVSLLGVKVIVFAKLAIKIDGASNNSARAVIFV